MTALARQIEGIRISVANKWRMCAALARLSRWARDLWPWRNSTAHIAAAQFQLEVEQARRISGEKGIER